MPDVCILICGPCVSPDVAGSTHQGHKGIQFSGGLSQPTPCIRTAAAPSSRTLPFAALQCRLRSVCTAPHHRYLTRSHLAEASRAKMADSSSTAESRVSVRRRARSRAPKPALAAALRHPKTIAVAVARGLAAAAHPRCSAGIQESGR